VINQKTECGGVDMGLGGVRLAITASCGLGVTWNIKYEGNGRVVSALPGPHLRLYGMGLLSHL